MKRSEVFIAGLAALIIMGFFVVSVFLVNRIYAASTNHASAPNQASCASALGQDENKRKDQLGVCTSFIQDAVNPILQTFVTAFAAIITTAVTAFLTLPDGAPPARTLSSRAGGGNSSLGYINIFLTLLFLGILTFAAIRNYQISNLTPSSHGYHVPVHGLLQSMTTTLFALLSAILGRAFGWLRTNV